MLDRHQIRLREYINNNKSAFKMYSYKNEKAKSKNRKSAIDGLVNVMDYNIDINDIGVTAFDEITAIIADDAHFLNYKDFKNHIWKIAEVCTLSEYYSDLGVFDLFNRIDWEITKQAFEKEGFNGV